MSAAVLVIVGAIAAVIGLLALWVWALARVEARREARERRAMRDGGPPVLGGAPRHMRRRRPPT